MRDLRDREGQPVALLRLGVGPPRPGPGVEEFTHANTAVGEQTVLGKDRYLGPEHVGDARTAGEQDTCRPSGMGCGEDRQGTDRFRVVGGHRPTDEPAHAVADHDSVGGSQRPDQTRHVLGRTHQVIAAGRLVTGPAPPQVHGDGTVSGLGQRHQL